MDEMLSKFLSKKKPAKIDDSYKSAKMSVLKDLHKVMGNMMGDDVKGLQKVTVAAPDSDGLKAGLEKAEDLLGDKDDKLEGEPEVESEMEETPSSLEEIEKKIAELEALKAKLAMKE